ncbi:MAG: ribonuclease HII [Pseudomonadota bacterium]
MADADPAYERELCNGRPVIGVDEVGRGPLAGPVVAGAAYLPDPTSIPGLRDSKALTEKRRLALTDLIHANAEIAIAAASAATIDAIGIEKATHAAMRLAVAALRAPNDAVILVDGNRAPKFPIRAVMTEVKADATCPSVSAAAIAAKTARDRMMEQLAVRFPQFGWHTNKGYGSAAHRSAILEHGPTRFHRHSFLTKILG